MGLFAVTGAAGGMGSAIRRRIESEGHECIGVDLEDAEVQADLSVPADRKAAVDAVAEAARGSLDGLVACAGLGGTVMPASLVARVNYFGAVAFLDGLVALLEKGEGRSAVAICSNSASLLPAAEYPLVESLLASDEEKAAGLADGLDGQSVYMQSKMALCRAIRRRAPTWGKVGLRLNGVAPGPVRTPLLEEGLNDPAAGPLIRGFPVPLGRWGEPSDIADAVWFLLGPGAAWVHGSVLFVDGGTDALLRPNTI